MTHSYISKEDLIECLLGYNYFPLQSEHKEELPPIFNSKKLTPSIANKIRGFKPRGGGYDFITYKRTRHPNLPRLMSIPHPRAYIELVYLIAENWESNISSKCYSGNSQLEFEVSEDKRLFVLKYNHIAVEEEEEEPQAVDVDNEFGHHFLVKTDIANFFQSIYSHSIPWALVGHAKAKANQRNKKKWYNQLDKAIMNCSRGETKGIAIGTATSSIISEILLCKVDEALREKYLFTRYIDDYKVFCETLEKSKEFIGDLGVELEKYSLLLNGSKTKIIELPNPSSEEWVTEMILSLIPLQNKLNLSTDEPKKLSQKNIKTIINKAITLSKNYPDGCVIKYALSAIIKIGVHEDDDSFSAKTYFENEFLKLAYYYPTIIPLFYNWIIKEHQERNRIIQRQTTCEKIERLFENALKYSQSDTAVWCLYYLVLLKYSGKNDVVTRCIESNDPMVMLMGMVYAKKKRLNVNAFKEWYDTQKSNRESNQISEYDVDKHWIVYYQLFFDNISSIPPYSEQECQKVFNTLKSNGVSFIDLTHEDFNLNIVWDVHDLLIDSFEAIS